MGSTLNKVGKIEKKFSESVEGLTRNVSEDHKDLAKKFADFHCRFCKEFCR
jgi:hypothetical protein